MSTTPTVLGNVPLEYTDPATGKQVSIPLSALKFTNGQLSVDSSVWTPAVPGFMKSLLTDLAQQQLVVPAPAASPKPALVITASDAGSSGNGITVTISTTINPDPTQTTFSFAIAETDTYTALTMDTIATVLGTGTKANPGTKPGLVHVVDGSVKSANGLPAVLAPPPPPPLPQFTLPGDATTSARFTVNNNAGTPAQVFILEAKRAGQDGTLTVASIPRVNATNKTFDLTVSWTKSVTGITLTTLQNNLGNLCYDIKITAPPSGIISVPVAGVIQLSGGTDGTPGTPASAIVFAGQ